MPDSFSADNFEAIQLLEERDLARTIKALLLVRAGAIPQLLGLVQRDAPANVCFFAMHALCWIAAVPPSFSSRVSAECIAAGAVPILLHADVAGTGAGKSTPEQRAAVSVLAKLAGSSEEHQAALLTQLIPLLVG